MPFTSGTCTGGSRVLQVSERAAQRAQRARSTRGWRSKHGPGGAGMALVTADCPGRGCPPQHAEMPAARQTGRCDGGFSPHPCLESDLADGADGGARKVFVNVLHILQGRAKAGGPKPGQGEPKAPRRLFSSSAWDPSRRKTAQQ